MDKKHISQERERELIEEVEALKARVAELEDVLRAVRNGEVDALVAPTPEGPQVFSLSGAESPYRTIIENINEGAVTLARDGTILYANECFSRMLGMPPAKVFGYSFLDLLRVKERERMSLSVEKGMKEMVKEDTILITAHKSLLPVSLSLNPMPSGEIPCVGIIVTDLSERKRAEEKLREAHDELEKRVEQRTEELIKTNRLLRQEQRHTERLAAEAARLAQERLNSLEVLRVSEELFRVAVNNIPDALAIYDDRMRYKFVNTGGLKRSGLPLESYIGRRPDEVYGPEITDVFLPVLQRTYETKAPQTVECTLDLPAGRFALVIKYVPMLRDGSVHQVLGFAFDITERKELEEKIMFQAYHDVLTNLPNRALLMDRLAFELVQTQRNPQRLAVMFMDLDRFKHVNDTLGHSAGDLLLGAVAMRLRKCIRESDVIARIGGDELNVLLTNISSREDAAQAAGKLLGAFDEPFAVHDHNLRISASIGISIYPEDGKYAETLLKNADIAMYQAKKLGGNNYQFFNSGIHIRTIEHMILESNLRRTLERGELEVFYQPQVDIASGTLTGIEALVRWNHPDLGLLDPATFIPLAEETGFIVTLDEWVLRTACEQGMGRQSAGQPPVCITVNLSATQFHKPNLIETVAQALQDSGFDPRQLGIEITESIAVQDIKTTVANLHKLREMGIVLSLDDFGKGYSSLNYLRRLPIDRVKMDRSLIRGIGDDTGGREIVKAVIDVAHSLKLLVIAEGVETEAQLLQLKELGCDEAQGYHFGRPLPTSECKALFRFE